MESPAYAGVFLLQAPDDDRPEAQESFTTRVATLGHTLTEQSLAQETQRYLDDVRPLEQKLESELLEGAVHSAAVYSIRFPVAELQSRLADRFVLEVIGRRLVGVDITAGGAAPSLPVEYARAADRVPIEPDAGSCGTAAFYGATVVADDSTRHPAALTRRSNRSPRFAM